MKRAALMAAALGLASCSAEQPAPTAPVATQANAAAALPAPAPAAAPPPPTRAEPPLTPDGWGPLRIGMTLAEVTEAAGPDADPEAVGGPEPEYCDEFRPARAPQDMLVMIEDGRLTRISLVGSATVRTDRGLALGAPASAVRATYGDALIAEPHEYSEAPAEYLTIWSGAKPTSEGRDLAARGLRYVVETNRKVAAIHAGGASIEYVEGCL